VIVTVFPRFDPFTSLSLPTSSVFRFPWIVMFCASDDTSCPMSSVVMFPVRLITALGRIAP
jgi:hypothetical protein